MKLFNLEGQRFGHWTVLSERRVIVRSTQWLCRCDCGKESFVYAHNLLRGSKGCKSCSCTRAIRLEPGQEVNGFVVVERVVGPEYEGGQYFYKVRCPKCGEEPIWPSQFLRTKKLKSCRKCRTFAPIIGNAANRAFVQYRNNAAELGRAFELTPEHFRNIIYSPCHYCGLLPESHNGIDRVNNDLGYIVGNSVSCCGPCNMAKKVTPKKEFLGWVDRVYQYQHEPEPITYAIGH
jgi:hypothetical protein